MLGFRYSAWDPGLRHRLESFRQLLEMFNQLLLNTHGDAQLTLDIMKQLQQRGYIDAGVDLDDFAEKLREAEIVRLPAAGGRYELTDKGAQRLRRSSLTRLFRDIKSGDSVGGHRTPSGEGASPELLPELKAYRFGDDIENIDYTNSLFNTLRREGHLEDGLREEDLVTRDREKNVSCATVLLLDISHSMILYGEDRFTPAKQVALALSELILTRYRRDSLDVVLFGDEAVSVPVKKLPFVGVGPFHTNTKAGLIHARRILEQRKSANRQIFMITDGKPTVIDTPGGGIYRNTFGLDERIINRTLDEAVTCRRRGIRITTFMVTRDPWLEMFVSRLSELNRGRAYFSSPEDLSGFVFTDYLRNRKRRG